MSGCVCAKKTKLIIYHPHTGDRLFAASHADRMCPWPSSLIFRGWQIPSPSATWPCEYACVWCVYVCMFDAQMRICNNLRNDDCGDCANFRLAHYYNANASANKMHIYSLGQTNHSWSIKLDRWWLICCSLLCDHRVCVLNDRPPSVHRPFTNWLSSIVRLHVLLRLCTTQESISRCSSVKRWLLWLCVCVFLWFFSLFFVVISVNGMDTCVSDRSSGAKRNE